MKNAVAFLASLLCVAGAVACAETPTLVVPGAPRFDGGWVGPGGRSATDSTLVTTTEGGWTAGSGNRSAGGDSVGIMSTTNSDTTCEERGGWTAGSGNREEPAPTCLESAGIGMIVGGRSDDVEPTSDRGVLIGSGH